MAIAVTTVIGFIRFHNPFTQVHIATIFEMFGFQYTLYSNGVLNQKNKNKKVKQLVLNTEVYRADVYYLKNRLLVAIENSTIEGTSTLQLIDEKTLTRLWLIHLPTFNLGAFYIQNNYVFVSGLGYLAKVTLNTGVIQWEIKGLYREGHFNSFEKPIIIGNEVFFAEVGIAKNMEKYCIKAKVDTGEHLVVKCSN